MANMDLLLRSLSYIEDHLNCEIQTEDIARACFASKSSLEKTFRVQAGFSVHDYILRRRMMKAARMMIQKPNLSLLDIAVEYGFSSHEAFTRAFFSIWNCNPSEFREKYISKSKIPELFPQITGFANLLGEKNMRRTVDISEMYDFIKERKDCYIVCLDVEHLVPINEISRKAGDIALSETMKRMLDASSDEDVVFRIGKDEFALITNSSDIKYAEEIQNKILSLNGTTFDFEDKKIPLNLTVAITKINEKSFHYRDIFTQMFDAIMDVRKGNF